METRLGSFSAATPVGLVRGSVYKHTRHACHKNPEGVVLDFEDPKIIFNDYYPKVNQFLVGQDVTHLLVRCEEYDNSTLVIGRPVDEYDKLLSLPAVDIRYRAFKKIPGLLIPRYIDYVPDVDLREEIQKLPTVEFVYPDED